MDGTGRVEKDFMVEINNRNKLVGLLSLSLWCHWWTQKFVSHIPSDFASHSPHISSLQLHPMVLLLLKPPCPKSSIFSMMQMISTITFQPPKNGLYTIVSERKFQLWWRSWSWSLQRTPWSNLYCAEQGEKSIIKWWLQWRRSFLWWPKYSRLWEVEIVNKTSLEW